MQNSPHIYIHIGMSKAGSSAIQYFLGKNHLILKKKGVLFPEIKPGIFGAHFMILKELKQKQSTETLKKILKEGGKYEKLILSCEGFWLLNKKQIQLLYETLQGYDTTIILYLRKPEKYLPSSYRQGIKSPTNRTITCEAFLEEVISADRMNFPKLIKNWSSFFNLRIRSYENVINKLEFDFLDAVSFFEDISIAKKIINPTPSDSTIIVLRYINKIFQVIFPKRRKTLRFLKVKIMKLDPLIKHLPLGKINDEKLKIYGKEVKSTWDSEYLFRHLPEEDYEVLISSK